MFFQDKSSKQISERLAQLQADLAQTKAAIGEAEGRAVQALAEGSSADADFGAVASMKAKAEAMRGAREILEAEKTAAERRERLSDAVAKRQLGTSKRAESAAIAMKSAKLLEKLSELEGVLFDGSILSSQRIGSWMRNGAIDPRIPDSLRAPDEMSIDRGTDPSRFAVPRSRALINEAIALEDEADRIEQAEGVAAEPETVERG